MSKLGRKLGQRLRSHLDSYFWQGLWWESQGTATPRIIPPRLGRVMAESLGIVELLCGRLYHYS